MPVPLTIVLAVLCSVIGLIGFILSWDLNGIGASTKANTKRFFILLFIGIGLTIWVISSSIMTNNSYEEYIYSRIYQYPNGSIKQKLNLRNGDQINIQENCKKIIPFNVIIKVYRQEQYTLGINWMQPKYKLEEVTVASPDYEKALKRVTNEPSKSEIIFVNNE